MILHIEWRTLQNYRPVFPCERLSVGQHGELVDDGRVQELHVVRPRLDPAESVESIIIISYVSLSEDDDDDGVSLSVLFSIYSPIRTGSSLARTLTLRVQIIVVRISLPRPADNKLHHQSDQHSQHPDLLVVHPSHSHVTSNHPGGNMESKKNRNKSTTTRKISF